MAAKTQKQRDQWTRFNTLGTFVGTACWIRSKRCIIAQAPMNEINRRQILIQIDQLARDLESAAIEMGWKRPI